MTATATSAATYHLDFDTDGFGNPLIDSTGGDPTGIGSQWQNWGLSISATNKAGSAQRPLLLFDSNPNGFTGGDADLRTGAPWGTEVQNKVLIIHEDGFLPNGSIKNSNDPDDDANGGIISFNFDNPVDISDIKLLDLDDFGRRGQYVQFAGYDIGGNQIAFSEFDEAALADSTRVKNLSSTGETGDNSLYEFALSYQKIARLDVLYPGSGAIAGLKWSDRDSQDIPEPMAAAGLLAVGALGLRLRHRRSSDALPEAASEEG
ncbi:hypothetical protein C7271_21015 [filamentous cyanobacterium CCP5]|nr:hypothetical protein C7271_21015 [filamentous cyanobacterium CCP5]